MRTKTTLAVRLFTRVTRVTRVDSPKTLISTRDSSARTFRPIFQSGTARPTLVGPLGPFYFYIGGGGGGGEIKIQETLFNVILIFRQGNMEIK